MPPRLDLRVRSDATLAKQLLGEPDVREAIEKIERDSKYQRTRRHLLATAVRLSPRVAPELHRTIDLCVERLEVETPIELYAYPSPSFNAAAVRPEAGRLFLLFSSELLEGLDSAELEFVAGHELGHHVFDHHSIPVGVLLGGEQQVSARLALQLFAWSRYAEVSADRAGHFCARSLEAVTRTLFKLASGLRQKADGMVMEELLAQVDDMQAEGFDRTDDNPRSDWFATHPFSPLRLKAAQLFQQSELMTFGGTSRDRLEAGVIDVMSLMEPGYLKDKSDQAKAMRRLLLAGGMLVAAAADGVSDEEIEALEDLLGVGTVTRELSVEALREDLPSRIKSVIELAPPMRRAQVLRDLCVIARADGHVDDEEIDVMTSIASDLELGAEVVQCMLEATNELD